MGLNRSFAASTLVAISSACVGNSPTTHSHGVLDELPLVLQLMEESFNTQNVEGLSRTWSPLMIESFVDVDGTTASTTKSMNQLKLQMTDYFATYPDVRTKLKDTVVNGNYVFALEHVSWTNRNGCKITQTSPVIFQLTNDLIKNYWYFPANQKSKEC